MTLRSPHCGTVLSIHLLVIAISEQQDHERVRTGHGRRRRDLPVAF
jgi:hypothetical protein